MLDAAGQALAARGEHLAGHDRPLPGADGGARRRHVLRGPVLRILEGAPCGITRACSTRPPTRSSASRPLLFAFARAAGAAALAAVPAARRRGARRAEARRRRRGHRDALRRAHRRQLLHRRPGATSRGRARAAALGAPRRRAARLARPPRGAARGARRAGALGRATAALVNTYGELFAAEWTPPSRRACRCSPARRAREAEVARALPALRRAARAARRAAGARGPRRRATPGSCGSATVPARTQLELGRDGADAVEERLARFVAAYPSRWRACRSVRARRSSYVDLRYPNGFALRVAGLERLSAWPRRTKNLVVGLDIGTSKVAALVAELRAGRRARGPRHGQPRVARA